MLILSKQEELGTAANERRCISIGILGSSGTLPTLELPLGAQTLIARTTIFFGTR
jgi:hypothetical protein